MKKLYLLTLVFATFFCKSRSKKEEGNNQLDKPKQVSKETNKVKSDLPENPVTLDLSRKAQEALDKVTGDKKGQVTYSKAELEKGMLLLVAETKEEAKSLRKKIPYDESGKDKATNQARKIVEDVIKNSDEDIMKFLLSLSHFS